MQKLLTSNIIPSNHPIKDLPEKLKIRYLQGLGEALCLIESNSDNTQKAKFCYDVLCESFLGKTLEGGWVVTKDLRHIKNAQKLCRSGLRFFRMSDCFWWDVYRIAYQSGLPIIDSNYDKSLKKTVGIFTKRFKDSANDLFFQGGNGVGLPQTLVTQYKDEFIYRQHPIKRILIVGTMSAGKSTLVNALTGQKVAKVKTTVCTTSISYLYNNPFIDSVIYSDGSAYIHNSGIENSFDDIPNKSVRFKGSIEKRPLLIIDTPGVDYAYDESHRKITYDTIKRGDYDLLLCVNNGPYIERNGENELIDFVLKQKKKIVFIFNQLDRFDPADDSIEESLKQFKTLLKSKKCEAKIVPFSGKAAYLLKKELDGNLSRFDSIELSALKEKMSSLFYDLGMYGTGICSREGDYIARCGLTNLETIIVNQ
ncbi:MAG: dynamin family protein [Muribaculaceae bacterium]|nr:dynamin family protein [Muribaculaceae bacterium]